MPFDLAQASGKSRPLTLKRGTGSAAFT